MTVRLPLSAKILLWFFLNLAALAGVFALIFHTQFRFDLDWVFSSSARQRVEQLRTFIVEELNTTAPDDWAEVIERFSQVYGVHFALFETNGMHLLGGVTELPPEVKERMLALPPRQPPPPPEMAPVAVPPPPKPTRAFLRTGKPPRYWLLQRTRLENPRAGGTMKVILVAEADSMSMGGLILDPAPWYWLMGGVVVFSVLFWLPLLHGMTRAIGQMTHTTRQIAEGRFDVRVSSRRGDELGLLAESINQMAARLNGLVRGQKRFLGDIAHELCSPLARLQMVLGILEQRGGRDMEVYTANASEKAGQIALLVNELLVFSRASFGESAVRLSAVPVRRAVEEAVRREAMGTVPVESDIAAGLTVQADEGLLVRALSNLLRNAFRYGGTEGPVTLTARREGGTVAIRVADCGPGAPEEELPKLFDAFYRLDDSRNRDTGGVGLGLTIVKTCVESCRGSVLAANREPHGLEVTIRLPVGPHAESSDVV